MDIPVAEFADGVYRFAMRLSGDHHVAEDLTQETFLRAWRHRRRLAEVANLRVWLFAVTANLWKDRLRRGRHLTARAVPLDDQTASTAADAPQRVGERDDVDRVLAAIEQLPPRQRDVLHLVTCEQLSLAETAEVLGMSTDAVKASLSVARKKMREWFADLHDEKRG